MESRYVGAGFHVNTSKPHTEYIEQFDYVCVPIDILKKCSGA
jgi:hypothetical protein